MSRSPQNPPPAPTPSSSEEPDESPGQARDFKITCGLRPPEIHDTDAHRQKRSDSRRRRPVHLLSFRQPRGFFGPGPGRPAPRRDRHNRQLHGPAPALPDQDGRHAALPAEPVAGHLRRLGPASTDRPPHRRLLNPAGDKEQPQAGRHPLGTGRPLRASSSSKGRGRRRVDAGRAPALPAVSCPAGRRRLAAQGLSAAKSAKPTAEGRP